MYLAIISIIACTLGLVSLAFLLSSPAYDKEVLASEALPDGMPPHAVYEVVVAQGDAPQLAWYVGGGVFEPIRSEIRVSNIYSWKRVA